MGELVYDVLQERLGRGKTRVEGAHLRILRALKLVYTHIKEDEAVHDLAQTLQIADDVRLEGDRLFFPKIR